MLRYASGFSQHWKRQDSVVYDGPPPCQWVNVETLFLPSAPPELGHAQPGAAA
jgi:hypothetical protein